MLMKILTIFALLCTPLWANQSSRRNIEADLIEGQSSTRNFVRNSGIEQNARGYAAYADAAGASPVDGTGGAPNVTVARSTASPLSGAASLLITKDAANRQGEGVSYDFTLDAANSTNGAQNIGIDFYYSTGGTFAAGAASDVQVFVYDVTNAAIINPVIGYLNATSGRYQSTFMSSSSSTSYRLIFHVATTSASAWTLKVDGVTVAPIVAAFGSGGSDGTAVLSAGNGFGSTNTNVRRYTTITTAGTAITCADSATLGASCTVNSDGHYIVNRIDRNTGAASNFGVAKNDDCTAGSGMPSVALADQMAYTMAPSNVAVNASSSGMALVSGDVIRACDDSGNKTNDSTAITSKLTIAKVKEPALPSSFIVATGGTITTDGNFKVHTFTSSGTFQITAGSGTVESLVVGGGGGGGSASAGGGGAGGLVYTTPGAVYGPGSYTVTVGAGGAGATTGNNGSNGGSSAFDTITASGGGGGGNNAVAGSNGGSGGGGGGTAGGQPGGTGTVGQGYAGGTGVDVTNSSGGGGGGCGSVGGNAAAAVGGNGGTGCSNSITGSAVFYASGGGGSNSAGTQGTASAGGGANGAASAANNATANTGGGGGGRGDSAGTSGAGGSGIVIVRYQFQ